MQQRLEIFSALAKAVVVHGARIFHIMILMAAF